MKSKARTDLGRAARAANKSVLLIAALLALLVPLQAPAGYLTDGTKGTPGAYTNPQDGVCVVGVKPDGTLDVNVSITNFEDCATYTNATLKGIPTSAACTTAGAAGNDGERHAWSTSICVDNTTSKNPISRAFLDRGSANMCTAKGGTVMTTGLCIAYGWQYMNSKPGEAIPYRSTITPTGYTGRTSGDFLGFCYTTMRMTSNAGYNTANGCPSAHNASATAPAGEWAVGPVGTDPTLYQTQASYDVGLGWAWDAANSRCNYSYGTKGFVNAALTKADGTVFAAAGALVDLTTLTTQGSCLAAGASWDNWLPFGDGSGVNGNASTVAVSTSPSVSSIVKLDATTPILSGGGNFYSGTGAICEKCHSDQSRQYMERYKPGYPKTAHKLAGDDPNFQPAIAAIWKTKGVSCEACHATGKATAQDVGAIVYPNTTGTNAGLPRAASGHNQTEYGSHLTGVCYKCHGIPAGSVTDPVSPNPAAVIPTSGGEFSKTAINLAPIANQFLASPHAKYAGVTATSRTVDVITRTNYASTFEGYVCRSASSTTGSIAASTATLSSQANISVGFSVKVTGAGPSGGDLLATVIAASGSAAPFTITLSSNASTTVPAGTAVTYSGIANGSILTTWLNKGVAAKIPNLDSTTNIFCTGSPAPQGDGTAYAGGFWVRDGEAAGTSNGVAYASSDQGNCMTCHDVHWSKNDPDPAAEPFRRECTVCHQDPGSQANSASGAPQFNLTAIKHPSGTGTPLAAATASDACVTCHMPALTAAGSKMHLWKISTTATYQTAGATTANADSDGNIKVDLNGACGQCHNSSGSAHLFSNTALAAKASGMHTTGTWPSGAFPAACVACHQNAGDAAAQQIKTYDLTPGADNSTANHHALMPQYGFTCNNSECHGSAQNFSGVTNAAARNGGGVKVIDITQPNTTAGCLKCHVNSGPYAIHHATTTNTQTCTSCHGTYGGVYAVPAFSATTNTQCLACHSSQIGTIPAISMVTLRHASSAATPSTCVQCHSAEPLVSPFNASSPSFAGCLSCHGASGPGPNFSAAQLTTFAQGMHVPASGNPTASFVALNDGTNPLKINVNASASTCPSAPCTYGWSWGDGTAGSGATASRTYSPAGNYVITLTVTSAAGGTATATQRVTAYSADRPPTAGGSCGSAFAAGTWTLTCTPTYTAGTGTLRQVIINWGDGTPLTSPMTTALGGPYTHTYIVSPVSPSVYHVTFKAVEDTGLSARAEMTTVSASYFSFGTTSGHAYQADGVTPLSAVQVQVKNVNGILVASMMTKADGSYTITLKPGTYTFTASKFGFTFPNPATVAVTAGGAATQDFKAQ